MMRLTVIEVLLCVFVMVTIVALFESCEPNPEVIVKLEFPEKPSEKEDRLVPYWFITAARGYAI
jgi:hypothetical protein